MRIYSCGGCNRRCYPEEHGERVSVCPRCMGEVDAILRLYTRIVHAHPKLRGHSPHELFDRIYKEGVAKWKNRTSSRERKA